MKVITLPRRVFQSPLIRCAIFDDQSHINLIRINKPYANGMSYAIHDTTINGSNGMYKTYDEAITEFMFRRVNKDNLVSCTITGNAEQVYK